MAGVESSNSSCKGEPRPATAGLEMHLFRLAGSELFLVDGDESALLQSGDFVLSLMKQTHSPLAAVLATVGDVQWPVGKDSPSVRVGRRRYSFALPGLVYGLHLHPLTTENEEERLEAFLQQYSTFERHSDITAEVKPEQEISAGEYWTSIAPHLERTLGMLQRKVSGAASTVAAGLISRRASSIAASFTTKSHLEVSPRMMKRIQQARRMSAIAKLFSKTLVRGAINPVAHVATSGFLVTDLLPSSSSSSSTLDASHLIKADPPCVEEKPEMVVVANVDAVAKVLEAVETAGKSLLRSTSSADRARKMQGGVGGTGYVIDGVWTLNNTGLHALFRATTQSLALNLAGASSSGSSDQVSNLHVATSSTGESTVTSTRTVRFLSPVSKTVSDNADSKLPYFRLPKPSHSIPKTDGKPPPPSRAQSLPSSTSTHSSFPLNMLYDASSVPASAPLHRRPGSLFQQYSRPPPSVQQEEDIPKTENESQLL